MKKQLLLFIIMLSTTFGLQGVSDKDRMLRDLDIIKSIFEVKYAPFEWKKDYANWSLDEEIDLAKAKIETSETITVHDYQRILHTFFISTRDYHVSNEYHSTEMALLPFVVKSAEGHYIITDVSKNYFQEMASYGFYRGSQIPSLGDELLLFDGKPIDEVINQLKVDEIGNPTSKTSQVMAEGVLTQRLRALGHQVPHGTIQLQFKTRSGEIIAAEMEWVYSPEKIANKTLSSFTVFAGVMQMFQISNTTQTMAIPDLAPVVPERYKTMMINPVADALRKDRSKVYKDFFARAGKKIDNTQGQTDPDLVGAMASPSLQRGVLALGTKTWQDSGTSHFKAYIYRSPKTQKRVGYIRLSTYEPTDNYNNVTTFTTQLASVLRYFESHTDALVIDQVDNPGGLFLYAYSILAMLTDHPLVAMRHQFTITQEDVAQAFNDIEQITSELQMGSSVSILLGYPITSEFLLGQLSYSEFIISEWEAGRTLTGNRPVQGIDMINPHPQAHYSKPLVILVDSRDFSCADIVPAILQDNGRALVFGEQTAGAGGIVKRHSYPNLFGLASFSYTASILERQNGNRLENLGVTPDMPYDLTQDDLLNGYRGYIKAVNEAVELQLAH